MKFYHATFAAKAREILRTKKLCSRGEPDVYVSNRKSVRDAYGDGTVLQVEFVNAEPILDDEFSSGRKDFRVPVDRDRCARLKSVQLVSKPTAWWRKHRRET